MISVSGKEFAVEDGITVEEAMRRSGFHPDSFLYLSSNSPIPMDTEITADMVVKAVKVASGG